MFKLEMETDNAAFDMELRHIECAGILQEITRKVRNGETEGKCRDANGNVIGAWSLTPEQGHGG